MQLLIEYNEKTGILLSQQNRLLASHQIKIIFIYACMCILSQAKKKSVKLFSFEFIKIRDFLFPTQVAMSSSFQRAGEKSKGL